MGKAQEIAVIGAGIGGLTAGALLAQQGHHVTVYEQAYVPGGCASTFKRQGFTFDVGATQVAGLEPGGIHQRIFAQLGIDLPDATYCDPGCAVFLPGMTEPVNMWRDPDRWRAERQKHFPGSETFWGLMETLFQASWAFQERDPVLPPRNLWDLGQLVQALRPDTLVTVPFTLMTVGDALGLCGVGDDAKLRRFLDMQLKLYSQVEAAETALLYAATALGISQAPLGLWHLQGSMQVLSDRLVEGLTKHGGELRLGQRVTGIHQSGGRLTGLTVCDRRRNTETPIAADQVIANVTVLDLLDLWGDRPGDPWQWLYRDRLGKLPPASGAFVVYLGVKREAIPADCPPHLQFLYDFAGPIGENNSLFVSVSKEGDGRAPAGYATLIASSFTAIDRWQDLSDEAYQAQKAQYTAEAIAQLGRYFHLTEETLVYQEAATPRTFAHYTARRGGIVGGVGQRVGTFGPFGIATRTPIAGLWLVGDSTHPGEGTAGVSYSALTAVRQLTASL